MSEKPKSKRKAKSKRGRALLVVDFYSPLSPEECLAHMEAGRSPVEARDLDVVSDEDAIHVYFVEPTQRLRAGLRERGAPHVHLGTAWAEPVWFEGRFQPTVDGLTHVQGEVIRSFGASWVLTYMITAGALVTLLGALAFSTGPRSPWTMVFFGGFVLLSLAWGVTAARALRARQLAQTLARWIEQRLNVERTK